MLVFIISYLRFQFSVCVFSFGDSRFIFIVAVSKFKSCACIFIFSLYTCLGLFWQLGFSLLLYINHTFYMHVIVYVYIHYVIYACMYGCMVSLGSFGSSPTIT